MTLPVKVVDIDSIDKLRPFPAMASRLLAACNNQDASIRDVADIISTDASCSQQLLKLANSSAYGFKGSVGTVDRAVVVLGFRQVKSLALSLSAAELFRNNETEVSAREALWSHSIACASIAKRLASLTSDFVPEEVFLAGIFHDVGKLVFHDVVPEEYQQLAAQHSGRIPAKAEFDCFGSSHAEIGARCCENWCLPRQIAVAAGSHHAEDEQEVPALGKLIRCANKLTADWQLGPLIAAQENLDLEAEFEELGIDPSKVEAVQETTTEDFNSLIGICNDD